MDMWLWTLVIFAARVLDVSLGTLRVQFIVRQKKALATIIGFVEVLIFIVIVSRVIQDIHHLPYVLAYAGGFATGTLLGMYLSEKLSRRVVQVTIVSNWVAEQIEAAVRQAGFALTRYHGLGRDGPVEMFDVICSTKSIGHLLDAVTRVDPQAFLYTHELAHLQGGHVYGLKGKL